MEKTSRGVTILIPTYKPGDEFEALLNGLEKQTYPIESIIAINTEKDFWNSQYEKKSLNLKVIHIKKQEFDHGGTRRFGMEQVKTPIGIWMTQDAILKDEFVIQQLVKGLEIDGVAVAFARQLPKSNCKYLEAYTRQFNYPSKSKIKKKEDVKTMGIKAYFCSDVCAAYWMDIYSQLGGFVSKTIFNEDMFFAAKAIESGYGVHYVANAQVIHSHNYSLIQQLRRNFDLGVSQKEYEHIFVGISSESEGVRMVKKTMKHLYEKKKLYLLPELVLNTGFKYIGFRLGKGYRRLSRKIVLKLTMNQEYWK